MQNICVFGDSIAKGVVLDSARQRYSIIKDSFISLAGRALELLPKNFSKFGCTVQKGLEMVNAHVDDIGVSSYTLLEFGGNDSDFNWAEISSNPDGCHLPNTPLDTFCETYSKIVDKVKESGGKPIVLNLPPVANHKFFAWHMRNLDKGTVLNWLGGSDEYIYRWHEMYNSKVENLARISGVPLIDIRAPFLALRNYEDYFCEDGTHPNEKGHALISPVIERAAQGVL